MNYLGKVINNCKYIYNEINAATLTGAIDVVVVEQPDGTYTCSPFHVRFGKMGVLRSKEKIVDIEMNGEPVDIHMKLGESGEAFFVEVVEEEMVPPHLATSPIPPDSGEETPDWTNRLDEEDLGVGDQKEVMASSTPKTFKAEKVEEETVLTNKQSAEFRPITGQASSTSLSGQDTDFTKEDSPSADERLPIKNENTTTVTNNSNNNNKRKRRKKSTKKKAGSQGGSSNDKKEVTNGGSVGGKTGLEEANSEPIFHLEDLDTTGDGERHQQEELCQHSKEDSKALDLSSVAIEGRDLHFFSDTEITPGSRFGDGSLELEPGFRLLTGSHIAAFPRDTCDFAPIQSDSELETKRLESGGEERNGPEEQTQSQWKWGELPTSASLEGDKQESQKWMLHNMLGFMKKTKHMRHKTEAEGIYLSELNSEDPEMAALYLPSNYRQAVVPSDYRDECREEDAESGNGPSLPQSPHSVEGAVCGPKVRQVDDKWLPEDLALSVCGPNPSPEQFEESQVSYTEFMVNPNLLSSPKLVVRIDGKYYPWRTAAPLLVSFLFFHKSLPQEVVTRLSESETEADERLEKGKPPKKAYSSWFYWSRNNPPPQPTNPQDGHDSIISGAVPGVAKVEEAKTQPDEVTPTTETVTKSETDPAVTVTESTPATGEPQALDEPTTQEEEDHGDGKTEDITKDEDSRGPDYNSDKYRKTLRLTSAQIASLKLHPGANEVQFSVTTAYQGTSKCKCFLFCWRYDDKIVVSDIDGTITKSDVLGHILPIVGKDWAQSGVAKLFTKIRENGYKLLYLSARAIGQSRLTRDYLKSIKQEDLGLPEGPMLLNPTSLLTAFHTEVIEKKPEEFKISCLRDIQALFPLHIKPFYAGYGNKINDVWAYQAIGIPIFRIFTINHKGELKHELTQTFQSTYIAQSDIVNDLFPPLLDKINKEEGGGGSMRCLPSREDSSGPDDDDDMTEQGPDEFHIVDECHVVGGSELNGGLEVV